MLKSNDNQLGVLLKMKLIDFIVGDFTISRINVTLLGFQNQTFKINNNEDLYFNLVHYYNGYLKKYDIFIHSSNNRRIKYYFRNELNTLSYNYGSYFYMSDNEDSMSKTQYINIKNDEAVSFYVTIWLFPKNILELEKEILSIKRIELNSFYLQTEKYFIFDNTVYQKKKANIFYDKKYGEFESYYIFS